MAFAISPNRSNASIMREAAKQVRAFYGAKDAKAAA